MSFNNNLNSTLGNTNIKNNSNYNLNSSNLNHSFNNSNNFPSGNFNNTNITNQDNKNLNNEIISKSIVYGSIAFWLGKKSEQNLTHKWCVYVRGINNEDLSYFIKEVVFTLHSTFENNVRTFKKWPYELYSSGWGEFDIKITIHFIDETIKPIDFVHFLKLYPPANQAPSTKKPIVSEFFDEIVFVNPKKQLRESLINSNNLIKNDSSIQIPINDEDKKSVDFSVFTIDDQMKEKNFTQQNNIENKLENLSITNHNQGYNNLEENNEDMEVEGDEFNQSNNQQGMNQLNFNQNLNNDSMSVFSNNINVK